MTRIAPPGPKSASGDKKRRLALDALYAELPRLDCAGLCAESCGPIGMSRVEWQRVCRAVGEERKATSVTCPILEDGRCAAYSVRPMLCRLWGLVEGMPCVFGCKPERLLSDEEGYAFLARSAEIGG